MKKLTSISIGIATIALAASPAPPSRGETADARVPLNDSIKEVPVDAPVSGPHRVRAALTAAEAAEPLHLVVSLRMRNLGRLRTILESGRTLSRARDGGRLSAA